MLYTLAGDGARDTNLGDRFQYNAAVSYRLRGGEEAEHTHSHSHKDGPADHHHDHGPSEMAVDLVLELNGEWSDKQTEGGETDENSGGNTVYLSPGLRLSTDDWSGYLSVGIPVVNDLNGIQAEPDWRVLTGFSVSLD